MAKKTTHDFGGEATAAEFRSAVGGEFLDAPNVPRGTKVYVRKFGTGCWKVAYISVEDSGIYIDAGDESNPQPVANGEDVEIIEDINPERAGDE